MDSNPYTRLLKMPNKLNHAKSYYGPTTAIFQSFAIIQPLYFYRPECPISPTPDGNSYVGVIDDAFTHYINLRPSPKNDAANALKVLLFDNWIVIF